MSSAAATTDVCVIGAGVAGLTVALKAARAGLRVVVCEQNPALGGLIQRVTLGDIDIDAGAESFATRTDGVAALCARERLPVTLVQPASGGAWLVSAAAGGTDQQAASGGVRRGRLPHRTILGIPADPGHSDVRDLVGEITERELHPFEREPSLLALVSHAMGSTVAHTLVDTVARGVYSRPAGELALSQVHPGLWAGVREGGVLSQVVASTLETTARPGSAVAGIEGGMWRLIDALATRARERGVAVHTRARVHAVRSDTHGVDVSTDAGSIRSRRVVIASGRGDIDRLLGTTQTPAPEVTLALARVRAPSLDTHPMGTGALVAEGVPTWAKAFTHVNAKWAWVNDAIPAGEHLVRLSARAPRAVSEQDVADALSTITGIRIEANAVQALQQQRWRHDASTVPCTPAHVPAGVAVTGTGVAGTGLAAVIPHAERTADAVVADLLREAA